MSKRIEKEIDRSVRDARAKEKRQRRKPAEDDTPVEPVVIKSHLRRLEKK